MRRQRSFASSRTSPVVVRRRPDEHAEQAVTELARPVEVLRVDAGDELSVVAVEGGAREQRLEDLVECFVTAPFFEPVAVS